MNPNRDQCSLSLFKPVCKPLVLSFHPLSGAKMSGRIAKCIEIKWCIDTTWLDKKYDLIYQQYGLTESTETNSLYL